MMATELRTFDCPSCGGSAIPVEDQTTVPCPYCGKRVIVPESLRRKPPEPPPYVLVDTPGPTQAGDARVQKLVFAAFAAFILLSMIVQGISRLFGGPDRGPRPVAVAPPKPVEAVVRPLESTLPRATRYGSLTFTVNRAEISNRDPQTSASDPVYVEGEAHAFVYLTLVNPLPKKDVYLDFAPRFVTADGKAHGESTGWSQAVNRQSTVEAVWAFQVPPATAWEGTKLLLEGAGKEPVELPLDGPVPELVEPVALACTGEATAQDVTYRILAASLDLDSDGERAERGKRFLRLSVRTTNNSSFAGGAGIGESCFRLITGGVPLAPVSAPIELLNANSAKEIEVVFVVPADVEGADLQVGHAGSGATSRMTLDLRPTQR